MNRSLILSFLLALSFLGMADSWYLYQSAVTDTALSCDIGAGLDGCNIVAQSPYSYLLGLPLALYGIGFFALMFALTAALFVAPKRILYQALFLLTILGSIASVIFLAIQFALIKALCIYCILSAAFVFLMLGCARLLWKRFLPAEPGV
ncbi:MAG: vitamin K epoxide reductase family protein [Patescibacteria group bacterium]